LLWREMKRLVGGEAMGNRHGMGRGRTGMDGTSSREWMDGEPAKNKWPNGEEESTFNANIQGRRVALAH
jgi:hypothetical protein